MVVIRLVEFVQLGTLGNQTIVTGNLTLVR